MRTFCTEGPVDPKENYTVPRTALVAEGLKKVEQWRYFTIFAPRQSGKTTYFQMLIEEMNHTNPELIPVWCQHRPKIVRKHRSEMLENTDQKCEVSPEFL